MQRPCDECGTTYTAKRASSKFCTPRCRVRANRRGSDPAPVSVIALDAPTTALLTDATRVELGVLAETADGILLLTLAARIDAVPETSPALATLSKEFAARKSDLMAHAPNAKANPFDELQALRERRRA